MNPCHPCRTSWQQKFLALDVYHPAIQTMADAAEEFAGGWFRAKPDAKRLLVLMGDTGCGKTHTAGALLRWSRQLSPLAWERGHWATVPSSTFYRWPEITDRFKEGQYGVMNDLFDTTLIALDDIGAEHDPSRNAAEKLCQVLSRRHRLWTVVTTNIAPDDWPARFDRRIADRLMRNSRVVDLFSVESYALAWQAAGNQLL